jgi:molybdopterin-guanine dinucleotide biosynthesis protein A
VIIVPEIYGLVLVGGRSTRMGRDKATLQYSDKPQAVAAYELLTTFCAKVFLSCRQGQTALNGLPAIHDVVENMGPMSGILSAFAAHPDKAWLVLACDLPFLTEATIRHLIGQRDPSRLATAYRGAHDGKPEPLCAIYEPVVAERLREFVARGDPCPRTALAELAVPLLDLPEARALDNVNQPHEFAAARAALKMDL